MTKLSKIIFRIFAVLLILVSILMLLTVENDRAVPIFCLVAGVFILITTFVQKTKTREEIKRDTPKSKQQIIQERIRENREKGIACCPKCGSTSLTANKKGYGIGKGVIGVAAVGAIGLAAGNINSGKVKITCMNCGYQFKPGAKR